MGRNRRQTRLPAAAARATLGGVAITDRRGSDLSATELHDLLRLRARVFVVEQSCAFLDLDGHDLDHATIHTWIEEAGAIVSYLRRRPVDGSLLVSRVCTAGDARGRGLATLLVRHAIERAGPLSIVLAAQAHLTGWYARLGFAAAGEPFTEDGIPHVVMRRRGSR